MRESFLLKTIKTSFPELRWFLNVLKRDFGRAEARRLQAVLSLGGLIIPTKKAATALLKTVIKKNGDVKRIYVGGLSMGGMGTFEAVYRYPKLFAAAIPICGGGDAIHYDKRVARTAFWIFHGADD